MTELGVGLDGGGGFAAEEFFLAGGGLVAGVVELFEHGALGEDVDGVPAAGLLAEAAAGAVLLDHDGLAEEVGGAFGEVELERFEGADVDAEFAAGADALVGVDDGFGPLLLGELAADVAVVVEDAFDGADGTAGAAVDAEGGVDVVDGVALAPDGVGRAAVGAGGAADAGFDDFVGHRASPSRVRGDEVEYTGRAAVGTMHRMSSLRADR